MMVQARRAFRSYWSNPNAPMSLGCSGCPDLGACGGQQIEGHGFDCLDHCCGRPMQCNMVCPHNPKFADRVREIAGFELSIPPATPVSAPQLPEYVPLIFHGSSRVNALQAHVVAMPLYRFFNRFAECRFFDRDDMCSRFKIGSSAVMILSGVAKDVEVERWWRLESRGRVKAISNIRRLGVEMVTTPNFSVVVDRPRWDDLHSIKRIAAVHHEFISEGLSAALHVNGRTQKDCERWAEYIFMHPEVTHIAYEFTTGTRNPERMQQHVKWLLELSGHVGRRLGLVLRGGSSVAGELTAFYEVSFLDSSAFEKAHHRFAADVGDQAERSWFSHHTAEGEPIDALLDYNVRKSELWLEARLSRLPLAA